MHTLDKFDTILLNTQHLEPTLDLLEMGKAAADALPKPAREKRFAELRKVADLAALPAKEQTTRIHSILGREALSKLFTTRDISLARFKRNEYPTLFEIQRPGTVFLFEVLSQLASMDARRLLAFRACVHRVHRGNVTLLEATLPERGGDHTLLSGSAGSQIAPESYVKAFERRWGAQSIRELGQVVLDFSELTEVQQAPFGVWGGSIARPSGLG